MMDADKDSDNFVNKRRQQAQSTPMVQGKQDNFKMELTRLCVCFPLLNNSINFEIRRTF